MLESMASEPDIKPPEECQVDEVQISEKDPKKVIRIGAGLKPEIRGPLVELLKEFEDCFAWSPADITGIDPTIITHRLNVDPTVKPVQQRKRKMSAEKAEAGEKEIDKLIKNGFIRPVVYPKWLSNMVIVKKKGGKWRVCIDFTKLNDACPKDSYPVPCLDTMVDNTAGHELLSFMDASAGYHQIFLHPDDQEFTAFRTARGIYCYIRLPFGLKNAGASYQRLANKMFRKLLGITMEVYIDDMLVKSKHAVDHVLHLRESLEIVREYNLKLNPAKCTFGVSSGIFLGYMVSQRGIQAHPEQLRAVLDFPSPVEVKDVQKLTGRLIALMRFIPRCQERCRPFFQAIKKDREFRWSEECEAALQEVKDYLSSPPLLARPEPGEPLLVYLAVSETAVSAVLAKEESGPQHPVYYTSKSLGESEKRYPQTEKLALALVTAARKLRPYFQSHPITVVTSYPLKKILHKPEVSE